MMIISDKKMTKEEAHRLKDISGKAIGVIKAGDIFNVFQEVYNSTRKLGNGMLWCIYRASSTVYMYGYMEGVRAERNKRREVNTNDK